VGGIICRVEPRDGSLSYGIATSISLRSSLEEISSLGKSVVTVGPVESGEKPLPLSCYGTWMDEERMSGMLRDGGVEPSRETDKSSRHLENRQETSEPIHNNAQLYPQREVRLSTGWVRVSARGGGTA
jgi:hypothetical protein